MIRCFSALVFLLGMSLQTHAQCAAGEQEYSLFVTPAGSFLGERQWTVLETASGDTVANSVCGAYAGGTFDFCLTVGTEYTINFNDDFGDGWNVGTGITAWELLLGGSVSVQTGTNPTNSASGDATGSACTFQLESSYSFTAAELSCTSPDFDFFVTTDCFDETYEIRADYTSFNGNASIALQFESDNPDSEVNLTEQSLLAIFNEGSENNLVIEDIPFGEVITVSILVGLDQPCNSEVTLSQGTCFPADIACTGLTNGAMNDSISSTLDPVNSVITVSGVPAGQVVSDLNIGIAIDHTFLGDLDISLISPNGLIVPLQFDQCGGNNNMNVVYDDDGDTFACNQGPAEATLLGTFAPPSGELASFIGQSPNGDWTLNIVDDAGGDAGNLLSWCLIPTYAEQNCELPSLSVALVDTLTGTEILDCVNVGQGFSVEATVGAATGNTNFEVTATSGTNVQIDTVTGGSTLNFGPYSPGNIVQVVAVGIEDFLCGANATADGALCIPDNDLCENAIALSCNDTIFGTTIGALQDSSCGFSNGQRTGVWYTLNLAQFSNVQLETCVTGTNYNTDISVFTGSCGNLDCFDGFGGGDGYASAFGSCSVQGGAAGGADANFNAEAGVTYYIMVSGTFSTSTGNFALSTTCTPILCTNPDITATAVDANGIEITDCIPFGEPSVFADVSVTGGTGNNTYEISRSIGTGAAVVIDTLAAGESSNYGPFGIGATVTFSANGLDDEFCSASSSISTTICPPDNATCDDAITVNCGTTYSGSTSGALDYPAGFDFCGSGTPAADAGGVWYTLNFDLLTEVSLNITGEGFTAYRRYVYTGTCDGLVCVPNTSGTVFGGASTTEFTAEANTDYYVLIGESFSGAVNFSFNLTCVAPSCSPTVTGFALANAAGDSITECLSQQGSYFVNVVLDGGTDNDFFDVSVNGGEATAIAPGDSAILGPIPALSAANITVTGQDVEVCGGSATVAAPQVCGPDNDQPCDAIALTNDGVPSIPYSNIFATADDGEVTPPDGGCQTDSTWCNNALATSSIWFTFVAPPSGRARIDGCSPLTTFDNQFAIYSVGDCDDYSSYELIGANDDRGSTNLGPCPGGSTLSAGLELCLEPGETYYLQVDPFSEVAGVNGLSVITITEVDGDFCDCVFPDIFVSTVPDCTDSTYVTTVTINDFGSSESFTYEAIVAGDTTTFADISDVLDIPGTPLGTNITVRIVFDPASGCASVTNFQATVAQAGDACDPDCNGVPAGGAEPGTACTTVDGDPGILSDDCDCIATPENDLCENATEIFCGDTLSGSTVTASLTEDFCDFSSASGAVWFVYNATANATVTIETCLAGTDFDTDSHVFTGSCDDLECYSGYGGSGYVDGASGCSFAGFATGGDFDVVEGETYYIMIDGFGTSDGNFSLSLTCELDDEVSLAGSVTGFTGTCDGGNVNVKLYTPGTAMLVAEYNTTIDASGNFTATDLLTGTYDVIVKVDRHLAKGFQDVVIAGGVNALAVGAVQNGDANNSNGINVQDLTFISGAYNTLEGNAGYNANADLNCSGGVNIQDLTIVSGAFNLSGAVAPLN